MKIKSIKPYDDYNSTPPLKGLMGADVVLCSLIVVILYHYACGPSLRVQQEVGSAGFVILTFDGSHQIAPPTIGVDQSQGFISHTLLLPLEYYQNLRHF